VIGCTSRALAATKRRDIAIRREYARDKTATLNSIGAKHGITRERVRQILARSPESRDLARIRKELQAIERRRKKRHEKLHRKAVVQERQQKIGQAIKLVRSGMPKTRAVAAVGLSQRVGLRALTELPNLHGRWRRDDFPLRKARVTELRAQGMSDLAITKIVPCSYGWIQRHVPKSKEAAARLGAAKKAVARRLRFARKTARLSQLGLAKTVGVHGNTIWNWEAGKYKPSKAALQKMAISLNVSVEWLSDGRASRPTIGTKEQ